MSVCMCICMRMRMRMRMCMCLCMCMCKAATAAAATVRNATRYQLAGWGTWADGAWVWAGQMAVAWAWARATEPANANFNNFIMLVVPMKAYFTISAIQANFWLFCKSPVLAIE